MANINILIACEQSQTICKAFRHLGFSAYSNDIEPNYGGHPEWHIIGDALEVVKAGQAFKTESGTITPVVDKWNLIIAHPPCTMLTHASAVARSKGLHTQDDIEKATQFFMAMLNAPADHVAIENPAPLKDIGLPRYQQILQPYEFGERFSKRVCLWLVNLPPLICEGGLVPEHKQWLKHCNHTGKRRSKTFEGIAKAMANQWGGWIQSALASTS